MEINYGKTKLMVFNPGKIRDFFPRFPVNNDELEVVEEIKLLGVIIRNDLSWEPNTDYIIKRANKKLWSLSRLKKLGAQTCDLIDVRVGHCLLLDTNKIPIPLLTIHILSIKYQYYF